MKPLTRSMVLGLSCGLSVLGLVGRADAATLELVFFLDGSASITRENYELQLDAYRSIFNNENFYRQVIQPVGSVAVSVLQFAGEIRQEVNWTTINNFQQAKAFGDLFTLNEMPKISGMLSRLSMLGTAIQYATFGDGSSITGVFNNGIQGNHLILDLGTDGNSVGGIDPINAANDARNYAQLNNLNFVINAISPVVDYSPDLYNRLAPLDPHIIGGTNNNGGPAFVTVASDIRAYERTLCGKIRREINPNAPGDPCSVAPAQTVPESNSLLGLLTMPILGLVSQWKKLLKER